MNRAWMAATVFALSASACAKDESRAKGEPAPKEQPMSARATEETKLQPATASTPDAALVSTDPVDRELDISSIHGDGARVRVRVPASWEQRDSAFVLTDASRMTVAAVQLSVMFESGASADDIARFSTILESGFTNKVQPNINSGDPALDAVRLDLAILEEGELPDGRFKVGRITKPAGVEGTYREDLYASCIRGKQGGKVVAVQAWAPIAREQELGPLIIQACKTFEVLR